MLQKCLITFCIVLYALGVPYLEINDTHVFNPDWTPHVRIHEVWQLITNSALGVLCLWIMWARQQVILAAGLSMLVIGGFLIAFALQDSYGGSMKYLDGSEKTVLGINIGLFGFGIAFALLLISIWLESRKASLPRSAATQ